MRLIIASSIVGASIVLLATVASARAPGDEARPANAVVRSPRPLHPMARGKTVIVSTPTGHVHVSLPAMDVAPADRTDPWRGQLLTLERPRAALDVTDPWTGAPMFVTSRTLSADTSDPWR